MLIIDNLSVSLGGAKILENLSADLSDSHITAVVGESGCGKTTLLNVIAGLVKADGGKVVTDKKAVYMFQEPRLFESFTALENVNAVLSGKKDTLDTAANMLEKVGFTDFDKYPSELSGGMQQRVALARTLAADGDLILLDEPLSALDEKSRAELLQVIKNDGRQVVMVTHNADEASVADKVLKM